MRGRVVLQLVMIRHEKTETTVVLHALTGHLTVVQVEHRVPVPSSATIASKRLEEQMPMAPENRLPDLADGLLSLSDKSPKNDSFLKAVLAKVEQSHYYACHLLQDYSSVG